MFQIAPLERAKRPNTCSAGAASLETVIHEDPVKDDDFAVASGVLSDAAGGTAELKNTSAVGSQTTQQAVQLASWEDEGGAIAACRTGGAQEP